MTHFSLLNALTGCNHNFLTFFLLYFALMIRASNVLSFRQSVPIMGVSLSSLQKFFRTFERCYRITSQYVPFYNKFTTNGCGASGYSTTLFSFNSFQKIHMNITITFIAQAKFLNWDCLQLHQTNLLESSIKTELLNSCMVHVASSRIHYCTK